MGHHEEMVETPNLNILARLGEECCNKIAAPGPEANCPRFKKCRRWWDTHLTRTTQNDISKAELEKLSRGFLEIRTRPMEKHGKKRQTGRA